MKLLRKQIKAEKRKAKTLFIAKLNSRLKTPKVTLLEKVKNKNKLIEDIFYKWVKNKSIYANRFKLYRGFCPYFCKDPFNPVINYWSDLHIRGRQVRLYAKSGHTTLALRYRLKGFETQDFSQLPDNEKFMFQDNLKCEDLKREINQVSETPLSILNKIEYYKVLWVNDKDLTF